MSVLTWELYQLIPSFLTTNQVCFQCGATFKEAENIGLHLCHIHPGIRMTTKRSHGPQAFFYTCCGRLAGSQGCLEIDHNASSSLEVADPYERLRQIRDFATMIVPKLLLRFITQPLQSSILYDSEYCPVSSVTHTFTPLQETAQRTYECMLTHTTQLPVYRVIIFDEDDDADIVSKSFNLDEEARLLWETSKESPLFMRLMTAASHKNQKAHTDCENAWRTRIGAKDEEQESCLLKERPSLPFLILGRINKKLF